jgi:hypothetical protein
MNNECKRWTRQDRLNKYREKAKADKLSQTNRANLEHYYSLLFTAERKRDLSKREWLPEFLVIVKVIESISRLEGIDVDYERIRLAEDS